MIKILFLVSFAALGAFASTNEYQLNCSSGFITFQDRADRVKFEKSEVIELPVEVSGQETVKILFESKTHIVTLARTESRLNLSLDKRLSSDSFEIVGFVSYELRDGNPVSLSLKDSKQDFDVIDCKIEKK